MDAKLTKRSIQLLEMGLIYDGQTFLCKGCEIALNFHYTDLMELSDEKYESILKTHEDQCDKLKSK